MSPRLNRRSLLKGAASAAAALVCQTPGRAPGAPAAEIHDTRVISHLTHRYHGWPTLAQRAGGELLLVCSGGREGHVCPFGRVDLMRSGDQGRSWTWPQVVMDGPIDDRDAGVLETDRRTMLVTSFSSLAYQPALERAEKLAPGQPGAWDPARLARWQAAHDRASDAQRMRALGVWMTRSVDGDDSERKS